MSIMQNKPGKQTELIERLLNDVMHHPHSDELLRLTQDQWEDDTFVIIPEVFG